MSNLKEQIIKCAVRSGADLIGFAAKDRFDNLDPRYNPFSIFPEGHTVILIGRRITRGTLRGTEEGSNFYDYDLFGSRLLDDDFTSLSCYEVVRSIEDQGWEAVPVFPNPKETYGMGVPVAHGRPAPNVTPDFKYAAVACGLGEISLNNELLTKKFGIRQRFQMIITDAELPSDPILDGHICTGCGKCADVCPLNAINKDKLQPVTIYGQTMSVAEIDYALCYACKNGAKNNRLSPLGQPDRLSALCNRTCLCQLEEQDQVENTFANPFRKREAWGIDIYGKSVKVKA